MVRTPPNIKLSDVPEGYGSILYQGYDWWGEALDIIMHPVVWDRMKEAKQKAKELDDTKKTPLDFEFGGFPFQIMPTGAAGGKEFVIFNDDYRLEFGSAKRSWSVQWRATAAGLAEYGVDALREKIYDIFENEGFTPRDRDDFIRVTRADYCFDIYSPDFSDQMIPMLADTVVSPSEVKMRGDFWARGHNKGTGFAKLKTLTSGAKGGCQVQVYNKCDEITEASGKEWVYRLWEQSGNWNGELENIWRVEVRIGGEWLKNRTKKNPDKILNSIYDLIADALFNRRLTVPSNTDSNRRRWALHPIYSMIIEAIGQPNEFLPINRQVTGRKDAVEKMLVQNVAGTLRSASVLKDGEYDQEAAERIAKQAIKLILEDREHQKKEQRAQERYTLISEAR